MKQETKPSIEEAYKKFILSYPNKYGKTEMDLSIAFAQHWQEQLKQEPAPKPKKDEFPMAAALRKHFEGMTEEEKEAARKELTSGPSVGPTVGEYLDFLQGVEPTPHQLPTDKDKKVFRYWIADTGKLVDTLINTSWLGRLIRPATDEEVQDYLSTPVSTTINQVTASPVVFITEKEERPKEGEYVTISRTTTFETVEILEVEPKKRYNHYIVKTADGETERISFVDIEHSATQSEVSQYIREQHEVEVQKLIESWEEEVAYYSKAIGDTFAGSAATHKQCITDLKALKDSI